MNNAHYFDFAATTRVDERVAALVMYYTQQEFGNSGSRTHEYGVVARNAVETARSQVAAVVEAEADEVIFTSGATEADNLALLGLASHGRDAGRHHIVSTTIEHKAVLEPIEHLSANGFVTTLVNPEENGRVNPDAVLAQIRDDTLVVSVMHVNNETGVIQPIAEIAEGLGDLDVFFHVDAAQGFGKELAEIRHPRVDLISVSGHKIYAPKGVGALVMRKRGGRNRPPLSPLMFGGGQERGLRPGTLPVPLVAGLGEAARLAIDEHSTRLVRVREIERSILRFIERAGGTVNGERSRAVPHIVNASFSGLDSEAFIVATKALIAVSNGAACSSHSYERSHVLEAMGIEPWRVNSAIRFSFSHESGLPDFDALVNVVESVRF